MIEFVTKYCTGVATTNSTNRYQKYKSVELGDQLLERQHCLIEVEEDESVCKVMLASPVSPLSGTGDRFSNTLHGDNDGDDGDIDDGDLYIMGAVCLCVCYVFSYFFFFTPPPPLCWENYFGSNFFFNFFSIFFHNLFF